MELDEQLLQDIRKRNTILFVGAGVSKNLGLPIWDELIDEMASELGFEPEIFKSLGNHLVLAEYYTSKRPIGKLRSWMDVKWHGGAVDIGASEIHRLIVDLNFPIIYTTNYDRWLELSFDKWNSKFVKVASVADLLDVKEGITQIVKLHGDLESDESIVLTESSYFERLSFEHPLDLKLRSDILGRSVLFVGYSLSDINIRYLLYKLQRLWDEFSHPQVRPQSYIFLARPNVVQQRVFEKRGVKSIVSTNDDPKLGLQEFLEALQQA